jgi:hypothetical protein
MPQRDGEAPDEWVPADDDDVQFLREQRKIAEERTQKLRQIMSHPSRNAIANSMARRGEV